MDLHNLRIGHGFDVHKYAVEYSEDKPLILAGVVLAEKRSLVAHSDGDVVLHAICDALLGAIAAGDIGDHFPDDDDAYAGADSAKLLQLVLALANRKGFQPVNIDVTVVAQVPRLSGYRQEMTDRLVELLQIDADRVNLKATTTERMGYIGREEGIACHCVALMQRSS